uniref:Uncharacterized protein n=1 Tax=Arundo donax TaxID=35708 RepID=A0A0A9B9V4_ARUDO
MCMLLLLFTSDLLLSCYQGRTVEVVRRWRAHFRGNAAI